MTAPSASTVSAAATLAGRLRWMPFKRKNWHTTRHVLKTTLTRVNEVSWISKDGKWLFVYYQGIGWAAHKVGKPNWFDSLGQAVEHSESTR